MNILTMFFRSCSHVRFYLRPKTNESIQS